MTIDYYTRNVFGRAMAYLADPRQAMQWNSITGKRTITTSEMNVLAALTGVTFNRVFDPSEATA